MGIDRHESTPTGDTGGGSGRSDGGRDPHFLVIGGGSAGFAGAIRAAELGARVTVVERGIIGGTCVNVGCVPSKTLVRAAELRHLRMHHPFAGIPRGDGPLDLSALVDQKRELVERLRRTKYRDVLSAYDAVEYVRGNARLSGPDAVEVRRDGGAVSHLDADRILLAAGSHPRIPAIDGLEDLSCWTSEEALEADEVPEDLLVVGGSAVGAELAQMFARLGCRVTLLEALPTLVPTEDPDLGEALARHLEDEGIDVHTRTVATSVARKDGRYRLTAEVDGVERTFTAERLLVATGRRANVEGLGLQDAGVETDDRGFIRVDERLRTTHSRIYAAGDCTPLPQFVYVAAKAGAIAAENALAGGDGTRGGKTLDLSAMPSVIFTDPRVASVGLTEEEARRRGEDPEVRTLGMDQVPRALANRDTRGRIKVVARRGDGRILGLHVLSPRAGEVIQTGVLAVKHGLTVDDLAEPLFPYLTEVEGLKLAALTFSKDVEQLSCCAG